MIILKGSHALTILIGIVYGAMEHDVDLTNVSDAAIINADPLRESPPLQVASPDKHPDQCDSTVRAERPRETQTGVPVGVMGISANAGKAMTANPVRMGQRRQLQRTHHLPQCVSNLRFLHHNVNST